MLFRQNRILKSDEEIRVWALSFLNQTIILKKVWPIQVSSTYNTLFFFTCPPIVATYLLHSRCRMKCKIKYIKLFTFFKFQLMRQCFNLNINIRLLLLDLLIIGS